MADNTEDLFGSLDFMGDDFLADDSIDTGASDDITNTTDDDEPLIVDSTIDDDNGDGSPDDKGLPSSPISVFASALHEKGFLSSFDSEEFNKFVAEHDGDEYEAFFEFVNKEIDNRADFIKGSLQEDQLEYLTALANGVPDNVYRESKAKEVEYLKITEDSIEDDTDLQRKLYTDFLKQTTKFTDEKIAKLVKQKEDLGELAEEALEALPVLKNGHKDRIAAEQERAARQMELDKERKLAELETLKNKVESTSEIIPNVKLTPVVQKKMFDILTKPAAQTKTGQSLNAIQAARMENPMEFDIKLAYLFNLTDGFKNMKSLASNATTSAVKTLKETLDRDKANLFIQTGKGSNFSTSSTKDVDTNDMLKSLKSFL